MASQGSRKQPSSAYNVNLSTGRWGMLYIIATLYLLLRCERLVRCDHLLLHKWQHGQVAQVLHRELSLTLGHTSQLRCV